LQSGIKLLSGTLVAERMFAMATNTSSSENYTASQWTQETMSNDLLQQRGLLIGIGLGLFALLFWLRRSSAAPEEEAATRLVRDMRHVDDPSDARDLLGSNLPTIVRPALLALLAEAQRQTHRGFRQLEREIKRL